MSFFKNVVKRVRTEGVLPSARYGAYRLQNAIQLRRFSISPALHEARVILSAKQLDVEDADCGHHVPTPSLQFGVFRTTMRRFVKPTRGDVFLDYGSGLGSAMLMAGTLPFRKIIGVERSSELNAKAADIIERYKPRLICQNFQFVATDATQYEVPDEVTVIYFYNPFWGDVLRGVFAKIRESLTHHPRRLRVIFYNPNPLRNTLTANSDWLTKVGDLTYPFMPPEEWFSVYRA